MGHTFVLRDGAPVWSLGTPGNVYWTVPQVLSNRLDFGMDPYAAEDAPRLLPLTDDYRVPVESRLGPSVPADLARLGVLVDPLPAYDYHMGSFQMCWRGDEGTLHSTAGPRRAGSAAGY
jgi:gamma-glutamyltranspeptidase/glutathione hydrolase